MDAIVVQGLSKSYDGKTNALDHLDFSLPQGKICGFLGPNGAGKTTTVKLLTGLLRPSQGEISIMGLSPAKEPEKVHGICGVLTETAKMYGKMTGRQNLVFFAETAGIAPLRAREKADALLKQLDLWDARDKKAGKYSTGMMQRLSLARALIHDPKVLFLDEPTSGLDPESAQAVNSLVLSLAKQSGVTVFLCTHQLRYAQDLCDRYCLIDHGKLLLSGDLEELCHSAGCRSRAALRLRQGDSLPGFDPVDDWWQTEIAAEEQMPGLLKRVIEQGHDVFEVRLLRPTLEDVYFSCLNRAEEEAHR